MRHPRCSKDHRCRHTARTCSRNTGTRTRSRRVAGHRSKAGRPCRTADRYRRGTTCRSRRSRSEDSRAVSVRRRRRTCPLGRLTWDRTAGPSCSRAAQAIHTQSVHRAPIRGASAVGWNPRRRSANQRSDGGHARYVRYTRHPAPVKAKPSVMRRYSRIEPIDTSRGEPVMRFESPRSIARLELAAAQRSDFAVAAVA
jgi:hypothetical protein